MNKLNLIENKFNKKYSIFTYSGTLAIETVLRCINIGRTDIVLVPNNTCYRVLTSILRAGAIPLIVQPKNGLILTRSDIETALKKYNVKAIIAIHQFGLNVNISDIKKACKKGEIVIEDASQGWDVNSEKKIGCSSDYIVLSMGKEKPLEFGIGGIILTNNNILDELDYNNIKSRYNNSKLLPYILPETIKFNIKKLINYADKRKKNNVKYANYCVKNLDNKKINCFVSKNTNDCYWDRFPIWVNCKSDYNKLIKVAESIKIKYEPSHKKLLQDIPLLDDKKYIYLDLAKEKRYFIFLKTRYFEKSKLKKFIEEINKI